MKVQAEVSFEWSHHRILSADSKVRTLRDSSIHSGSERVKEVISKRFRLQYSYLII